jgi:copper chaperone NosL
MARAWVTAFALVAAIGLADFYKWEYDYGHDLDLENAIIRIEGMSYQPPLIGSKQLLNFRATSLPAAGGYALIASLALGVLVVVLDARTIRRAPAPSPVRTTGRIRLA